MTIRPLIFQFQSMHPVRGATVGDGDGVADEAVSIHAPHAGRDCRDTDLHAPVWVFQSTRPMRGATIVSNFVGSTMRFQSTRPMRGATLSRRIRVQTFQVSIHAPRAGRDPVSPQAPPPSRCFNPRAPCGARPPSVRCLSSPRRFQSTRPVRGATVLTPWQTASSAFQSTRPVRGAT